MWRDRLRLRVDAEQESGAGDAGTAVAVGQDTIMPDLVPRYGRQEAAGLLGMIGPWLGRAEGSGLPAVASAQAGG